MMAEEIANPLEARRKRHWSVRDVAVAKPPVRLGRGSSTSQITEDTYSRLGWERLCDQIMHETAEHLFDKTNDRRHRCGEDHLGCAGQRRHLALLEWSTMKTRAPVLPGHVRRLADRPMVGTVPVPGYAAMFNAGVLYHEGAYHLFARGCVRATAGTRALATGSSLHSDIVVFISADGLGYSFQYVLARGGRGTPPVSKTPASSGWSPVAPSSW